MKIIVIAMIGVVVICGIFSFTIMEICRLSHEERKELCDRIQSGSLLEFKNLQEKPPKPKREQKENKPPNFV
jgi:hypothetical protein